MRDRGRPEFQWITDSHAFTAGEVAYDNFVKVWTETDGVKVLNSAWAHTSKAYLWYIYAVYMRINRVTSPAGQQQGGVLRLIEPGPTDSAPLVIGEAWGGDLRFMSDLGYPIEWGIGVSIWPGTIVAGDFLYTRIKYALVSGVELRGNHARD